MSLTKWSLKKIQFLLSHIENFVEDNHSSIRDAVRNFEVQTGLDRLVALHGLPPGDSELPIKIFERIAPFYEAGLLFQLEKDWRMTDFFWRGQIFGLEPEDQISGGKVIRDISPLRVNAARAEILLEELKCSFLPVPREAKGFLFRPSEKTAYVLISNLPELWLPDHVNATLTLLNRSFSL